MRCLHCDTPYSEHPAFSRPLDGGRAFGQSCPACGHLLAIRPRLEADPPVLPTDLTSFQIARLHFVKWRLAEECLAQIELPTSAA
jgi:hypothetical protein